MVTALLYQMTTTRSAAIVKAAHSPTVRTGENPNPKEFRESNTYFFVSTSSHFRQKTHGKNTYICGFNNDIVSKSSTFERKENQNASKALAVDNVTIASLLRSE